MIIVTVDRAVTEMTVKIVSRSLSAVRGSTAAIASAADAPQIPTAPPDRVPNWAGRRSTRATSLPRKIVDGIATRTVMIGSVPRLVISAIVTFYLDSIAGAWKLLLVTGAGTGSVLLLRWFWWRINAWSEVAAMIAAFAVSLTLQTAFHMDSDDPRRFAYIMIITVAITTVVWLGVTFATPPEPKEVLLAFYRRTRPMAAGWGPIAKLAPEIPPARDGWANLLDWAAGCILIYGVLFGTGKLLLHEAAQGAMLIGAGVVGGAVIYFDLSRRGWSAVTE